MPEPTTACPDCHESEQSCRMTPMFEGGACCAGCKARGHHRLHPLILRPAEGPAPRAPMTQAEEDRVTAALLRLAAEPESGRPELYDQASLNAYRSLAESRGVDLERVLRAACRDDLRAIVAMPAAT